MRVIYTIGHSNRSVDTLLELLNAHAVELVIDIRAFPRSRRHPHFNRAILAATLACHGVAYEWLGDALGGYRKPRRNSPHTALTDAAFRGFADYMGTEMFTAAIDDLTSMAASRSAVIMCAESDYHHCHRQFIADHLLGLGVDVRHILGRDEIQAHRFNGCRDNQASPAVYNKHEQGDLFADH